MYTFSVTPTITTRDRHHEPQSTNNKTEAQRACPGTQGQHVAELDPNQGASPHHPGEPILAITLLSIKRESYGTPQGFRGIGSPPSSL